MSLFKVKTWWSNNLLKESLDPGLQNAGCLKIDKFEPHTDSDCVIIGDEYYIRIYKPNLDQNATDILLEFESTEVVLHIETGKFIGGIPDRQILVLHPQSYVIYQFEKKEGHTDAGDQHVLKVLTKHNLTIKALSLICGSFGKIKTRDLICVQGLDGSLNFFDQETFLFMCIFNDVIIPGPLCYIPSNDSFVIAKSTWILEIYSYQQLREFSEITLRQNKKNLPQWSYNPGEEVSAIQVIQTSTNFSTIAALGERHLYCFQDNGLMKYMIKFNYMPMCFCAYLIGWYYEPTSRLLVMVASDDSKLYIYEGTTLLWCSDILEPAIMLSRCFLKSLSGGLVTLSPKGVVNISYLGTEPDLNANVASVMNEVIDPEKDLQELAKVEEELQSVLEDKGEPQNLPLQKIKIKADVGKPTQILNPEDTNDTKEPSFVISCPVVVMISCEEPDMVQNILMTFVCYPPFFCSDTTISIEGINGTEILESQILLNNDNEISDSKIEVMFTITDKLGKITVVSQKVLLPISLYCSPTNLDTHKPLKLVISTNQPSTAFENIFSDFSEKELYSSENNKDIITLEYRFSKKTVTLKLAENVYSLEANDFPEITVILEHFIIKLSDHYIRMGDKDFNFNINLNKELFKQITYKFLKSVETHALERITLKEQEDELNILQKQFTLVQKKLLVQYGSLPPGNCEPLEFLMRDTHERLIKSVGDILLSTNRILRLGSILTSMGRLIMNIFKQTSLEPLKLGLIEEALCLGSLYENFQEWEEVVTKSLSYILNKVLNQTEKDKEKLAPATEHGILTHINLKRFLKQLRNLFEKLFSEAFNERESGTINEPDTNTKITRIEELVDVI